VTTESWMWEQGIKPMLCGVLVMGLYVGWLFYFYRKAEPRIRQQVAHQYQVHVSLDMFGWHANQPDTMANGSDWAQRPTWQLHLIGLLGNLGLFLAVLLPFILLIGVWAWAWFR
jgi:hypothetical protein